MPLTIRRRPHLLREAREFRYLWLSRTISATGAGMGRTALVLLAAKAGPAMVSLVLLCVAVPQLLGPMAGAIADRVDQRRLLAGCEAGQGVVYAVLAIIRPPGGVLLALVAAGGLLATLMSPAGKGCVPRLVPRERLAQANALIGLGLNLQVIAGPAIGGALAGLAGPSSALAVNAASFFASALVLTRLPPLPAQPAQAGQSPQADTAGGLIRQTIAGVGFAMRSPVLRALVLCTLVFVSFAAMDNVALVFLVQRSLRGSSAEYGGAAAAFGVGMVAASLMLTAMADRRPAWHWLAGGIVLGAAGTAATGLAPDIAVAAAAQLLAGAGNTAELVGADTLIQQSVCAQRLGRAFGVVYTAAQAGSVVAYGAAGPLIAATSPRSVFLIAGAGTLAGLAVLLALLRAPGAGRAA